MLPRLSVEEMIGEFGPTYRSIDIRCAAVKEDTGWTNAYTVIRLTYEAPSAAEERLCQLQKRHGTVHADLFRVLIDRRPFSEWQDLCDSLARGIIKICDTAVNLGQRMELAKEHAYLQPDYSGIRPFDSNHWPVANFWLFPHQDPLTGDATAREAARLGYRDAYEAVNLLCQLNVGAGQALGSHFLLSAPAFAVISGARASLKEHRIEVAVKKHASLSPLTGVAVFSGPRTYAGEPPKHRVRIDQFLEDSGNGDLRSASACVSLEGVEEDDAIQISLLHPRIGELHSFYSHQIRNLVPPAERNVLFEALKFFCPEPELRMLLSSPHKKQGKKFKPEAAFELHIAWLLGLFGLSTAVLGEYEHIVAPETKVRRGTVDVLAASQRDKKLVLVACTIGVPKEDDFSNLLNTARIIADEVFAGTSVRVLPVVCTGVRGQGTYREDIEGLSGLPILDADLLEVALELVKAGRERDFLAFLENPIHSNLGRQL